MIKKIREDLNTLTTVNMIVKIPLERTVEKVEFSKVITGRDYLAYTDKIKKVTIFGKGKKVDVYV